MSDIALSKGVAAGGDGQPFVISGREITAVESGNSGLKIRVRGAAVLTAIKAASTNAALARRYL